MHNNWVIGQKTLNASTIVNPEQKKIFRYKRVSIELIRLIWPSHSTTYAFLTEKKGQHTRIVQHIWFHHRQIEMNPRRNRKDSSAWRKTNIEWKLRHCKMFNLRTSLCKNQTSWKMKIFNPPFKFCMQLGT